MRVTSMSTSTKLKGMKVSKSIKSIKKIKIRKRLTSLKKGKSVGTTTTPRIGIRRSSSKWISVVRKRILRPKFRGHKKSNKNIIIIHNNTSITANEEDNRTSCATVKENNNNIVPFKGEDVTSIDSGAPPPQDQEAETTEEEDQISQTHFQIIRLREEMAALLIQSVFRGHLARRAYRALRSLVKLQAVVRGACVRRQARIALHCMNTMVRLQVRIRDRQLLCRPSDAVEA
ncbi:unnamed protein product [Amaranthus hypochondriacus]